MAFLIIGGLVILIAMSIPIASVLGILTVVLAEVNGKDRLLSAAANILWEQGNSFLLLAVPLFILLGEIMLRSGIASRMYSAVSTWLSWLPGGLMHANIGASALFAATSGSSVATIATIGTVAYPEIEKKKYQEGLFLGSLAAGGTLGILIPPSIAMIVYGVMTNTSIPELYLAGILPGLLLAALFVGTTLIACLVRKDWGGVGETVTWGDRLRSLPDLIAPLLVFVAVVGSIYAGIATPTEAASFGVCTALILAAIRRTLSLKMLLEAFERTMLTTSMILIIVFAALFLNFVMGFLGITRTMLSAIEAMELTPAMVMLMLVLFYIAIGMFMETLSMMLLTLPIVFPLVMGLGVLDYSDVWFGIILTLLMEMALITPPIGLNLFIAQGIRARGGPFSDVALGALPFLIPMLGLIVGLMLFPGIATWLPDLYFR